MATKIISCAAVYFILPIFSVHKYLRYRVYLYRQRFAFALLPYAAACYIYFQVNNNNNDEWIGGQSTEMGVVRGGGEIEAIIQYVNTLDIDGDVFGAFVQAPLIKLSPFEFMGFLLTGGIKNTRFLFSHIVRSI